MRKESPGIVSRNQSSIDNTDPIVLKHIDYRNVPDTFGYMPTKQNKVFRMYQCRICKGSFKRSQGVLFISGFYCNDHNPKVN